MIARHKQRVTFLPTRLGHLPDRRVRGLDALDRRLVHPRVPDHVRRGEVVHQELVLPLADALAQAVRDARGAHLRVEVVRRDLGGRDELAVLARELLLDPAVEEEGDVRVLLRLGDVALLEPLRGEVLGQHVAHVLRAEGDGEGVVGLVLGHGGDGDVLRVGEGGERGTVDVAEELGGLADAVGAVVEEEAGVVVLDAGLGAADDDGFQELVVLALLIARLDRRGGVAAGLPFAGY